MPQDSKKTLNLGGQLLDLSIPRVMGIVNVTPDSFYAGSRVAARTDEVIQKVGQMLAEGATMLDVGGYSTRPGAVPVGLEEEWERVEPVVEAIRRYFPEALISVDTFRAEVARWAVERGAHLINDVSGGTLDEAMLDTVARLKVPYVLMHMRGTPQTMAQLTHYDHLVPDVMRELRQKLIQLRQRGVADVLIDPGFGFAKTIPQNFELVRNLAAFQSLGCPLLVGISRKTTIWRTLGITPDEALNGTTVLNTLALQAGASILRVHDVRPAVEAIKLWRATMGVD
ncbi:dihydropteroate synthase [Rhabdobacter roseus]|uniref:dihydropteroate synthase n=1 Tax=Rhabdobacter roseus TaxID=1655419 RepID=UPI00161659E3